MFTSRTNKTTGSLFNHFQRFLMISFDYKCFKNSFFKDFHTIKELLIPIRNLSFSYVFAKYADSDSDSGLVKFVQYGWAQTRTGTRQKSSESGESDV